MLEQALGQKQKLRQEQILAPQQLQSLEMLALPLAEMEQKINRELQENPTLELLDGGIEQLAGNPVEEFQAPVSSEFTDRDDSGSERVREQWVDNLLQLAEKNRDSMPPAGSSSTRNFDNEEKITHFWDSMVNEPTLIDLLQEQLSQLSGIDPEMRLVCLEIIGSIDHGGYLQTHLADIATARQCSLEQAEQALAIVQQFEPPGIAARNLRESLLLQLERQGDRPGLAWKIVAEHLDDLARNRLRQMARKLKVSISELKPEIARIRNLRPYPGSQAEPVSPNDFVVPEVFVEIDENNELQVTANREYTPQLRISSYYLKLLNDPGLTEETKKYIREKLNGSRQIMKMIEQREATIVRIARSLVNLQKDFFLEGVNRLIPLTMSQVADDLGLHETTVSRAVAGKYMMTPHGLFAFRSFFTAGYRRDDGESVSNQQVKQAIREIVSNENRSQPLSDQKLVEELKKQGFQLARRTVTKYREELEIQPSSLRRRY